jgi:hypothetical protein|tara:strand:+ start:159 stop:647 length:489 start_codon:yes stop_codon:yes gene_type:complete
MDSSETATPIELPVNLKYAEVRETAEAACRNKELLEAHDLQLVTPAAPVEKATTKPDSAGKVTVSQLQAVNILKEHGNSLNATPAKLRDFVVNSLILETQSDKASERISALVNIGRISEVGLFADKKEIKVTHQNSQELRQKLKESLLELKENKDGIYEVAK